MNGCFEKYKGQCLIALGAIIWGTQGPFAQFLMKEGASPLLVSVMKLGIGSMLLVLFMIFKSPQQLKIDRKGLLLTAVIGLVSQAGFNLLYYNSVQMIGIANAAVLIYTSPVFFLALSVLFFKEVLSVKKVFAALLCVLGCAIAVTGGQLNLNGLSVNGIMLALLAAVAFAIMGALGKRALLGYEPMTIIAYSFFWGFLFLLPESIGSGAFMLDWSGNVILGCLGIGMFPAALAYFLYFTGVRKGVSLSQAGVISALEMVSAVLIAWTLFAEAVNVVKVFGVLLILFSIILTEINWSLGGNKETLSEMK